jgi:hypothetical protein
MVCGLHLRASESTVGSRKTVLETRALRAGKIQSWLDEETLQMLLGFPSLIRLRSLSLVAKGRLIPYPRRVRVTIIL